VDTDVVKQQVWMLAGELNTEFGERLIEPDQQRVKKENISLKGRNGERLYIKPATDGYLVGLSGDALAARMTPFMEQLAGERHGYGFPREKREPCWILRNYEQVRETAKYFAAASLTRRDDPTITANGEAKAERTEVDVTRHQLSENVSQELRAALVSIYEEMMWLAGRPNVTPSRARAWYTHVMAESVKLRVRQFTGLVSRKAVAGDGTGLRLEHYRRIQTTLTDLVSRHRKDGPNPEEFLRTLIDYEAVHIVTIEENYAAMRAKGDYQQAGIVLVPWHEVQSDRRGELWTSMLRGKVANAEQYRDSTAE
jgi:hypothetical protein